MHPTNATFNSRARALLVFCAASSLVVAQGPPAAARLDLADLPRLQLADGRALLGRSQHVAVGADVLDLRDQRAHVTFGPDPALGVTDAQSFALELELRTQRGAFGTVAICRQDAVVHYSFTMGRSAGCLAFEPWSWARTKLLSRRRVDDGAWHVVVAMYDKQRSQFALFVDGALEAQMPVDATFAGSASPSLRLGHNLDPGVQQPFGGEIRRFTLRHDLPSTLLQQIELVRATEVLPLARRQAELTAWLAYARRARPPQAESRAAWERKARIIRAQVQDACGLWPPPYAKSNATLAGNLGPLANPDAAATDFVTFVPQLDLAVRHSKSLEREHHTLTRIYWQTFAGYFAGGWLYQPRPAPTAPAPAILCPHGHWEHGARNPVVQSRCIALAQQGYVVLAVDSVHLEDERIGLSSLSVMTWNNLRAFELLRARADVDSKRIGCTGASGGAQQTYYLTALDCGLAAAVPAVMACHFEDILPETGVHCSCNHTPHLVRAADMPQMAAAFAPRPQFFLTVTGDWTKRFPTHGFPAVQTLYGLFDARDAVSVQQWNKGHAYDQEMREAAYAFFARTLRGQADAAPKEPEGGVVTESLETMVALEVNTPPQDSSAIVAEFRARLMAPRRRAADAVQRSLRALFRPQEEAPYTAPERLDDVTLPCGTATSWSLPAEHDVSLPVLVLRPRESSSPPRVALMLDPGGKAVLSSQHQSDIVALLQRGVHVVLADVRYTGEWDLGHAWRDLYGRFFGLDEGVLAVRDVRRIVASLAALTLPAGARVAVIGHGSCGATAMFAAALDPRIVCSAAPTRGGNYRDVVRRPLISRILLHADLDDVEAILGARALVGAAATPAAVADALR